MKYFTLFISCFFFSLSLFAGGGSEKIHSEFGSKQGVLGMSFSKQMLDAFDLDMDWKEAVKNLQGDFESIKVLVISDDEIKQKYQSQIKTRLKRMGYKEVDLEGENEDIIVYTDKKRKNFNEVHILSRGDESGVLISIYGNFVITDK